MTDTMTPQQLADLLLRLHQAEREEYALRLEIHEIVLYGNATPDVVGMIPDFLDYEDPRPAAEQFNERYAHGGGWRPHNMTKFKLLKDGSIKYPGDKAMKPRAAWQFRDERIIVYDMALVLILQKDGSFEISRMD
jgi:hypothetical protein